MKDTANEIFGVFERYKAGQCTYDRALEDASNIINQANDRRPIIGYIRSNALKRVLYDIFQNKKKNAETSYMYDCQIHQNEIETIKSMLESF